MGQLRSGFAYVAVVAVVSLGVTEGLVRLLKLAPRLSYQYWNIVPDPYLPFKPRPLSTNCGRSASDEFDFSCTHNSLGFRDVEHQIAKPPGVFRILGIGDSNTYGEGAAFEETYLLRLEQKLNDREGDHPVVEIVKAGIMRYFPEPERLLLEHYGLQFQPDLVLVGFTPNDLGDTFAGIKAVRVAADGFLKTQEANELGDLGTWLYLHSHAGRIVLRKYITVRIAARQRRHTAGPSRREIESERTWAKVFSEYTKIIRLCRSRQAKVAFIHIPQKGPWGTSADVFPTKVEEWCRSNDVPFIDTLPILRLAPTVPILYWPKDGHPTGAGYEVIAEAVFDGLQRHRLVP